MRVFRTRWPDCDSSRLALGHEKRTSLAVKPRQATGILQIHGLREYTWFS